MTLFFVIKVHTFNERFRKNFLFLCLADCLQKLGAIFADTRDDQGLQRFVPFNPENLFNSKGPNMKTLENYDVFPIEKVNNFC